MQVFVGEDERLRARLIATDLDGTLLRSDKSISKSAHDEIRRLSEKGCIFVAATGRGMNALPEEILENKAFKYAIVLNGAAIYDISNGRKGKKLLWESFIPGEHVKFILDITKGLPVYYECFFDEKGYSSKAYLDDPSGFGLSEHSIRYLRQTRIPVEDMRSFIPENISGLNGMDIVLDESVSKSSLKDLMEGHGIYVTTSSAHLLEICNSAKDTALRTVMDMEAVPAEDTVAFGDGDNDAAMLGMAGVGVAMKNGSKKCKASADRVTGSNDDDGVAEALSEIL